MERARWLRQNATLSEVLLWNQLKSGKFGGLNFNRQKIIGNYIADLYCPQLDLVIEIDGCSHSGKYEYDAMRQQYLNSLGLRVLHISDIGVKKNMDNVLELLSDVKKMIETDTAPEIDSTEWFVF